MLHVAQLVEILSVEAEKCITCRAFLSMKHRTNALKEQFFIKHIARNLMVILRDPHFNELCLNNILGYSGNQRIKN